MSTDPPSKKPGRPSRDVEGHPTVPVSVTFSRAEYQRLHRAATTLRMSVQDVVRLAVEVDLSRKY